MYIVTLTYVRPLEDVDRVRPAHREFLTRAYAAGQLLASGPQDPRVGGVLIVRDMPREKLDALLDGDPYKQQGIAEYSVVRFEPVLHVAEIAKLLVAES